MHRKSFFIPHFLQWAQPRIDVSMANGVQHGGDSAGSGEKSHLFNFTGVSANKAGMGADRKLVADFVYQKSKNSQYTQHQIDLDAKQHARAEAIAKELKDFEQRMTCAERQAEEKRAEAEMEELEKHRDLSRTHCVVDMDMFYAAVEIRDQPELANKPVAVGGLGMICTANYVARLYGVRSAMPGFIAVEMVKNPQLVGSKMPPEELIFVTPNFAKYTKVAMQTREIFREYDPNFQAYTLDEAYLDLTDFLGSSARDAEEVVQEMRDKVKASTGLTCSAGIGPNRMVAKIASDEKKPDGQTRIQPSREAVLEYMDKLPVRKLPGCGKVLEHQISTILQINTCAELRAAVCHVRRAFASRPKTSAFLLRAALGLSGEELSEEGDEVGAVVRKSLSCERTFRNEFQAPELRQRLQDLCRSVAEDMAASVPPLACRVVTLKVKTSSFEVRNKQISVPRAIGFANFGGKENTEEEVNRVTQELFKLLEPVLESFLPCTLRLMGVRISSFRDQKQLLLKGQRQLCSFFSNSRNEAAKDAVPLCADSRVPSAQEVIELLSEDEAEVMEPAETKDESKRRRVEGKHEISSVLCPVCGKRLVMSEADGHVNGHFG
eukprot:s1977_g6.t1